MIDIKINNPKLEYRLKVISENANQSVERVINDIITGQLDFCKVSNGRICIAQDPLYMRWAKMMSRWYNDGAEVCEEWKDFLSFRQWAISNGYTYGAKLHKKNHNKSFTADNCEFILPHKKG